MATLGSLVVELGANVGKLQADMNKAVGVVDRASAGIRRAATLAATALGAIGAGLTLSTIAGAARQVIDLGDKLRDLSFATGQSVEQLSFLEFAAGQSGTSIDAISTAAARLSKNLVEVASGRGEQAAEALRTLGLAADDLSRLDLATQIGKIGTQLAAIDNPAQRAATGAALFGKQFKELAPLILEGEDGVGRLIDRFIELNGVITRDQADKFDAFNDSLGELRLASRAAGAAIATELAPPLTALFSSIATAIPKIGPALSGIGKDFDTFLTETALKLERFNLRFATFKAQLFDSERFRADANAAAETVAGLEEKLRVRRNARRTGREETDVAAQRSAVLNPFFGTTGIEVDPEAAAKAAEKASREAQRAADALQRARLRDVREYNATVEDTLRDIEDEARQWEDLDRRRLALRKATQTDLEAGLAELAEAYELAGANSDEYGRTAIDVFNKLNPEIEKTSDLARDLGITFSSAFEDAVVEGEALSDVLKGLAQDVLRVLVRESVTNPLTDAVQGVFAGAGKGGLSGFFSNLFGGFRANGGPVMPGKAYVVGERGPELLIPGTAGTVVPGGGGVTVNVIGAPSQPQVRERTANGRRQIDLVFADAAGSATAAGMLAPLGVLPPLVSR